MKKGLTVMFVLVAFVLLGASMVAAQEKEMRVTVTAGADAEKACAKEMNLTDEQKTKLGDMRRECSLKGEELRADLMKLRVVMKRAMGAAEPNLAEIEAVVKKMSAVREKIQMNRIECMLASRKMLGPDWREHCCGDGPGNGPLWIGAEGDDPENIDVMIETSDDAEPGEMRIMRLRGGDEGSVGRRGDRKMIALGKPGGCAGSPMAHGRMGETARAGCPMMQGRGRAGAAAPGAPMKMMKKMHMEKMGGAPGGGCGMMQKGMAGGGCSSSCMSSEKECKTIVMKKGAKSHECSGTCGSRAGHRSRWESRMFRPQGKKTGHRCSGDCKGMESGCKMMKP